MTSRRNGRACEGVVWQSIHASNAISTMRRQVVGVGHGVKRLHTAECMRRMDGPLRFTTQPWVVGRQSKYATRAEKKKARMPAASLASCDGTGARILRGAGTVTAGLNSHMVFRDCRARGYLQCFSRAANHGENSTPPEKLRHPGKCSPGTVNREGPVTS